MKNLQLHQTYLGPTYSSGGVFSGDASVNPYFYTWNAVHLMCLLNNLDVMKLTE